MFPMGQTEASFGPALCNYIFKLGIYEALIRSLSPYFISFLKNFRTQRTTISIFWRQAFDRAVIKLEIWTTAIRFVQKFSLQMELLP